MTLEVLKNSSQNLFCYLFFFQFFCCFYSYIVNFYNLQCLISKELHLFITDSYSQVFSVTNIDYDIFQKRCHSIFPKKLHLMFMKYIVKHAEKVDLEFYVHVSYDIHTLPQLNVGVDILEINFP